MIYLKLLGIAPIVLLSLYFVFMLCHLQMGSHMSRLNLVSNAFLSLIFDN